MGSIQLALGPQDQLTKFAGSTFAAACLSNAVGVLSNKAGSVGNSHAQANPAYNRQVWQIITQIGDLFIA